MEYEIEFSESFLEELEEICDYITIKLKSENVAKKLRTKMIDNISSLRRFPEKCVKINKRDRLRREYRRMAIDNYVILYCVIKEDKVVLISHIYYGRRNYLDGLI